MLILNHWTQTAGLRAECEFHWMQGREPAAGATWERSSLCAERHTDVAMNLRSELGDWSEERQQVCGFQSPVRPWGWLSGVVLLSYFRMKSLRCL